jgi:hypothetical protein
MTKPRISLHWQAREGIVETFLSCVLFTEPGILIFKSTASALMEARSWPYFDPDYETNGMRISPPRYDDTGTSLKSYSWEHLCAPFECFSLFWFCYCHLESSACFVMDFWNTHHLKSSLCFGAELLWIMKHTTMPLLLRLTVAIDMASCWRLCNCSPILIWQSLKLTSHLMAGGSWSVSLEYLRSFSLGIGWNKNVEIAPK